MNPRQRQVQRNFGGLRFPEIREPDPGPLSVLSMQFKQEESPEPLTPAVSRLLSELPAHIRTKVLQKKHMRTLERVAQRWNDPVALRHLFNDLIFDNANGRNGFSFEAIVELTELNEHVKRVKLRDRPSVWDQALGLV